MANTEEMLFSETDSSCAYCGIRDYRVLTIHHIIQQEPKDESYDNKIVLCHNCHHLYHQNKGPAIDDLKTIKKRLILKTLTQQGINALKEAYREGSVFGAPYLLNHLRELQLLELSNPIPNVRLIDAEYKLTKKGKAFTEKWDLK